MDHYRTQIDAIDEQIIQLLGQRFAVTSQVGEYKHRHRQPILDPAREAALKSRLQNLAAAHHVDPALVSAMYDLVLQHSRTDQAKNV